MKKVYVYYNHEKIFTKVESLPLPGTYVYHFYLTPTRDWKIKWPHRHGLIEDSGIHIHSIVDTKDGRKCILSVIVQPSFYVNAHYFPSFDCLGELILKELKFQHLV